MGDGDERRIQNFRDLRVWQQSMDLVDGVYCLSLSFPPHERYGLAGQLQRAAISVPSNLAEGHTREHSKEYLNHISIAQGSLAELETQLEIATRQDYLTGDQFFATLGRITTIRKQLFSLRNSIIKRK